MKQGRNEPTQSANWSNGLKEANWKTREGKLKGEWKFKQWKWSEVSKQKETEGEPKEAN